MSEDYRKGYQDGFKDGFKAGTNAGNTSRPISIPYTDPYNASVVCRECGMEWKGAMAYSCLNQKCPIQPKVTSYRT